MHVHPPPDRSDKGRLGVIKARVVIGGRDTMILGLTRDNVNRLLDNQPIMFDGAVLGWPDIRVLILGGNDDDDIIEHLRAVGVPFTEQQLEQVRAATRTTKPAGDGQG